MRTGHTTPGHYEVRVQGRLESRWSTWFDGFTLTPGADGTTVIAGTVVDQAALHGLLESLRDLGLPLVSVIQQRGVTDQDPHRGSGTTDAVQPTIPEQESPR